MADEAVADVAIRQVFLAELGWGPEVQVAEIGLTVEKGGMTLAGTARSLADRRKVEETAWRAHSVTHGINKIRVR